MATLLVVGLAVVTVIAVQPRLSSFEPGAPRSRPGTATGAAEGWVKSAEPETNTIRVASGFLGLDSVAIVVTLNTLILVEGKEGGFDDLREGRRVRADYETRADRLLARRIEVLADGPPAVSPAGGPADRTISPPRGPVPEPTGVRAPGAAGRSDVQATQPGAGLPVPASPAPRESSSRVLPRLPAASPARRSPPEPVAQAPRAPTIVATPDDGTPAAREDRARAVDPSAVIDWLLKQPSDQ